MSKIFILLAMMFCHIVDDYYLQGWLASAKQKKWWATNAPNKMYSKDYVWALLMHSFSWSFMIMLPIAFFSSLKVGLSFAIIFVANVILHAAVDNVKANLGKINLIQDQLIHMGQILVTFCVLILM